MTEMIPPFGPRTSRASLELSQLEMAYQSQSNDYQKMCCPGKQQIVYICLASHNATEREIWVIITEFHQVVHQQTAWYSTTETSN